MTIYSPNREERAFLYQEAQELAPLIKDLGSLSVVVEETTPRKSKSSATNPRYRVTFVVAPESIDMQVQATHKSLFEAAIAARDEAQRQLNAIVNSLANEAGLPGSAAGAQVPPEMLH